MKRYLSVAVLLCAAALTACEKNAVQDITGTVPASSVRFFNFGVNAPSVNFYANDRKMTAITSATGAESTLGTAYGSVGSGGFYSGIEPGPYTFTGKISAATDKDLAISSIPGTLANGKNYSIYLSGFYNTTTKTVDGFIVEDPFPATYDYSVALVRFVNAISNSDPMTMFVRDTSTKAETAIGAAVAYKSAGAFVAVPNGVYTLNTRLAGSATNAIVRSGVSLVAGKVYTISARGDMTVVSTTATNRPFLDNTANR